MTVVESTFHGKSVEDVEPGIVQACKIHVISDMDLVY
jgi:hypothetical protein